MLLCKHRLSLGAGQDWGSQSVYPSPTWQPLRESRALRHTVRCASMGRWATKSVCSALLHFRSLAYFFWSLSVRNKYTPRRACHLWNKYQQDCLLCLSVFWSIYWSSTSECMTIHGGGGVYVCTASPFMSPSIKVFVHLALLWDAFSKTKLKPIFYSLHRHGDWDIPFIASAKLHCTAKKISDSHISTVVLKVHWNSQLHTFFNIMSYCDVWRVTIWIFIT